MKIFKFGGASVKDASGVKNLLKVIKRKADSNTIVIVSAMGKTTNALENIVSTIFLNEKRTIVIKSICLCNFFDNEIISLK